MITLYFSVAETQPTLMLTGPAGMNNIGGGGAPYANANSGAGGAMPSYQGYSM